MAKGNFNKTHIPEIVWPQIFERICEGKSLTGALKELNPPPSLWWAKKALRENPDLRNQYEEACQLRADYLVDELMDMVNCEMPEGLDNAAKSAWVQHLRVKTDTAKWVACKFNPKAYGERMNLDVTSTQISITAVLAEANKRVAGYIDGEVVQPQIEGG